MEFVEALRDVKDINAMKKVLKKHAERDYVLFVLGINTGLKLTEMLDLRVGNILDEKGNVSSFYVLNKKKDAI